MNSPHTAATPILQALASACDDLTADALRQIDPAVAARLAAGTSPYILIRMCPLRAAVLAETAAGETITLIERGDTSMPAALDEATWLFVTDALDDLPEMVARHVAAGLRAGSGRLGVVVAAWPAVAIVAYFDGTTAEPLILRRVACDETQH